MAQHFYLVRLMLSSTLLNLGIAFGAFWSQGQLHFHLFTQAAGRAEGKVCLFTEAVGQSDVACFPLTRDGDTLNATVTAAQLRASGIDPAKEILYGYRLSGANGEADVDDQGHRFNPNKLVLDPYALGITHGLESVPDARVLLSGPGHRHLDSGPWAPKGIILPESFRLPNLRYAQPATGLRDDVIYEMSIRGFTKGDLSIPENERGTFRGAIRKLPYLKDLGISLIELMPIQKFISTDNQAWGYMTLGYFAFEPRFFAAKTLAGRIQELAEFSDAVHSLRMKWAMDVVYNHTGEGGVSQDGLTANVISFRGIDNATYYDTAPGCRHYMDHNGCGPDLAVRRAPVYNLMRDSLRWFHGVFKNDALRFDLASVLGNQGGGFHFAREGVLESLTRDLPFVSLIAEPWGVGYGTQQQGQFPTGWSEWNDNFRNVVRAFLNKQGVVPVTLGALANVLAGSADQFQARGRAPGASVNFVTAHDGFTLADLFRFNGKRNSQPWGVSDGGSDNELSWDQGGDRAQQVKMARLAMMMLLLSPGTPMFVAGDERLRSLDGHNNPWNIDNERVWIDWRESEEARAFTDFTKGLIAFRRAHPSLMPARYGQYKITWHDQAGRELSAPDMQRTDRYLGRRIETGGEGDPAIRAHFLAVNADFSAVNAVLPAAAPGHSWFRAADSAKGAAGKLSCETLVSSIYQVEARSGALFVEKRTGR